MLQYIKNELCVYIFLILRMLIIITQFTCCSQLCNISKEFKQETEILPGQNICTAFDSLNFKSVLFINYILINRMVD